MIYKYDSTFEGLLCAYELIFNGKDVPYDITAKTIHDMFEESVQIITDPQCTDSFSSKLEKKFRSNVFRNIYLTYLSEIKGFEMDVYRYLKDGFSIGADIDRHLHLDSVDRIKKNVWKVVKEAHRLKGFLRFSLLDNNVLYSPVEPDHNVIPLISSHFKKRFGYRDFIVHDRRRKKALIYFEGKMELVDVLLENIPPFSENEKDIRTLWKVFFDSVTIKPRLNSTLQRNFLPVRYRKNMTEFK